MERLSDYFGENVFTKAVMQERLPKEVYAEFLRAEHGGGKLSMAAADVIAQAMMEWALEKGATQVIVRQCDSSLES